MAHKALGLKYIEAFICSQAEYKDAVFVPFLDKQMRAWKGGQAHEDYKLFEGCEGPDSTYDKVKFLYKGEHLRIEVCECLHIHFGELGRYRIELGRRDFLLIADALEKWES